MPQGYAEWYESVRESEGLTEEEIRQLSPRELAQMSQGSFSNQQAKALANVQEDVDIDLVNERNPVEGPNQASLDDDSAYRPTDASDTIVKIKNKANITADQVDSIHTAKGTKFARVDGKIYGAINE